MSRRRNQLNTPKSKTRELVPIAQPSEQYFAIEDTTPNELHLGIKSRVAMWVGLTILSTLFGIACFAAAELGGLSFLWAAVAAIAGTILSSIAIGLITLMALRASIEWKLSN